ncbi:MAG: hypothetical protein EXR99_14015 [Gemmataceae bacterium]|nr:hypothetical protein [Gemmataceae bacterium]
MPTRRDFLLAAAIPLAARRLALAAPQASAAPLKLAIVTTEWRFRSHAWHMGERFLAGYPKEGKWHRPPVEVVSAYVDQFPEGDLSRGRAKEFGFKIYPTIAEALRQGGDSLAVDAVLLIGEHGNYPFNEIGQHLYPRYQFFKQIAKVFKKDGKAVPVFNDKHLSWNWEWAKEMVDLSKELKFPFLAGSSLPVTWRMPSIDLLFGSETEEVMCVAMGGLDSYDFHALEVIQCMAERRHGGETGVAWVHGMKGEAVWKALESNEWDASLFEACLARSQTLGQPATASHRLPTPKQRRELCKEPLAYRFQYRDGTRATMLLMNGLVGDFNFAARIKGEKKPLSTLFYLPPNPNVTYSAALMSKAEEMFVTGKAPYPVERTLLTSGILQSCIQSLAAGKKLETPHLKVVYSPAMISQYWRS